MVAYCDLLVGLFFTAGLQFMAAPKTGDSGKYSCGPEAASPENDLDPLRALPDLASELRAR
ncbi:hypothetical protein HYPP_02037 [Hyphomicrobium sp. ghe19]|nr:hypothetical protein HYPP_02037 [Hyphomicrobium sp. ghe19]